MYFCIYIIDKQKNGIDEKEVIITHSNGSTTFYRILQ